VVLHDVADDAELVEVAAAALSAERLLEGDADGGNVVAIPGRAKKMVAESEIRIKEFFFFFFSGPPPLVCTGRGKVRPSTGAPTIMESRSFVARLISAMEFSWLDASHRNDKVEDIFDNFFTHIVCFLKEY
jgi:hypothetical protein